jgi:hypothetical protein
VRARPGHECQFAARKFNDAIDGCRPTRGLRGRFGRRRTQERKTHDWCSSREDVRSRPAVRLVLILSLLALSGS